MSRLNYTIRYMPFSEFTAQLKAEMSFYDAFNIIDNEQLLYVSLYALKDLGIRIYQMREDLFDVIDGKVYLGAFFHSYNWAYLTKRKMDILSPAIQGRQIEQIDVTNEVMGLVPPDGHLQPVDMSCSPTQTATPIFDCCGQNIGMMSPGRCVQNNGESCFQIVDPIPVSTVSINSCCSPNTGNSIMPPTRKVYSVACDKYIEVVEHISANTYRYALDIPLYLDSNYPDNSDPLCDTYTPQIRHKSYNNVQLIRINNGWLYTNFMSGKVYVNYYAVPHLDNELLVPEEPIIREYLMYACKRRILENALLNNYDRDIADKLQLIEVRYREYRDKAKNYVKSPTFNELYRLWRSNRKAMYQRYFESFKNYH